MKKILFLFISLMLAFTASANQYHQIVSDPYFKEGVLDSSYFSGSSPSVNPMGQWFADQGDAVNKLPFAFDVPEGNQFYDVREVQMTAPGDQDSRIYQYIDLSEYDVTANSMFILKLYYRRISETSPLIDVDYWFYVCADSSNPVENRNCEVVSLENVFTNGRVDDPNEYLLVSVVNLPNLQNDETTNRMMIRIAVEGTDENAAINQVEILLIE